MSPAADDGELLYRSLPQRLVRTKVTDAETPAVALLSQDLRTPCPPGTVLVT